MDVILLDDMLVETIENGHHVLEKLNCVSHSSPSVVLLMRMFIPSYIACRIRVEIAVAHSSLHRNKLEVPKR